MRQHRMIWSFKLPVMLVTFCTLCHQNKVTTVVGWKSTHSSSGVGLGKTHGETQGALVVLVHMASASVVYDVTLERLELNTSDTGGKQHCVPRGIMGLGLRP